MAQSPPSPPGTDNISGNNRSIAESHTPYVPADDDIISVWSNAKGELHYIGMMGFWRSVKKHIKPGQIIRPASEVALYMEQQSQCQSIPTKGVASSKPVTASPSIDHSTALVVNSDTVQPPSTKRPRKRKGVQQIELT